MIKRNREKEWPNGNVMTRLMKSNRERDGVKGRALKPTNEGKQNDNDHKRTTAWNQRSNGQRMEESWMRWSWIVIQFVWT